MLQPPVAQNVLGRVRAWLAINSDDRLEIAKKAGVDEKTLRLAASDDWNPTVKTLEKLESVIPADWHADEAA